MSDGKVKGLVEAKNKKGTAILIGDIWYSTRNPSDLASAQKGMEVTFEYARNGDFHNIEPSTFKARNAGGSSGTAVKASGYSTQGVELGHAAKLAMHLVLSSVSADTKTPELLDRWEENTKEIYERMKDMGNELEQGKGHFGRELPDAKPKVAVAAEDFDDDVPF